MGQGSWPLGLVLPLLSLSDQLWHSREKAASESPSCWREEERWWLGGEGRAGPEEQPAPRLWAALPGHTQPQVVECAQPRTQATHTARTLWSGGSGHCWVDPPALCQVSLGPSPSSRPAAVSLVHLMMRVLPEPTHPTNPQTEMAPARGWGLSLGRGGHPCPGAGISCWVTRTAGTGGCGMRLVLWGELGGQGEGRSVPPRTPAGAPSPPPAPQCLHEGWSAGQKL